jgi:hypothetical protein
MKLLYLAGRIIIYTAVGITGLFAAVVMAMVRAGAGR